jgi:predicted nucleotidyltransferase
MTSEEIRSVLSAHKSELIKNYKLKEIAIFGSYVRGEQKTTSDVDILVDFEEVPDLLKFIELEQYLEELLNIKVDLVRKSAIRPELKHSIINEAVQV